jgi:hypothetical protein
MIDSLTSSLRRFWPSITGEHFHASVVLYAYNLGSAQDVALQELRIESFFPDDKATRHALTAA